MRTERLSWSFETSITTGGGGGRIIGPSALSMLEEEEAPAAADAGADPKQDDVKPVVFIGLFIATLFTMGMLNVFLLFINIILL